MNKTFIILLSILLTTQLVDAQSVRQVEGLVVDENNVTIPYVSLRIGSQTGTMTNNDGLFVLKFEETVSKDSLLISYIGYKNLKIPLSGLYSNMKIRLVPAVESLNEVIIRPYSAESIIRQAIARISENYDTGFFEMKGFYRETGKIDTNYLSFAEASLNILNHGYTGKRSRDQVVINKERSLKKVGEQEVSNPLHLAIEGALTLFLLMI
ncbi:carboxypeptidase-like regulatory domain-containing protein [Pedobacter sp. PAMC26386]|nr:carboxypeptidase-like regulatory domain-containing protein [Pedobacter sp. PAMC26386]